MKLFIFLYLAIQSAYSIDTRNDYIIYSIKQPVPMGIPRETIVKNYFINIGSMQGMSKGTDVTVRRTLNQQHPFLKTDRLSQTIEVATLSVIEVGEYSSIAILKEYNKETEKLTTIKNPMIGDQIRIKLTNTF